MGLRRIADAHVGAALAGEVQREGRLAGGDGQREHQFAAVDLDLAEGVVLFGLAGGQGGFAEGDAVGLEPEAVAVQVVGVGHLEADLDGFVVDGAGGGAKGLVGGQGFAGGMGAEGGQQEGEEKGEESERTDHGRQCGGRNVAWPPDGSGVGFRNGVQGWRSAVSVPTQAR